MSPRVAATGTVRDGVVTVAFGPCKRHSQNGLTAAADGLDGLCAGCRATITADAERRNTYNGSQTIATEPPRKVPNPKGGILPDSTARKKARLAKFEVALIELYGRDLDEDVPAPLVRQAGVLVGIGERKAREYKRELLRREEPAP